jgi:GMP synthase-like glutamine amidotransferase
MIAIFQHGEYEPAGAIAEYLDARNEPFRILRLYEGDALPSDPPDRLIILGGQMSVNDESTYPFLSPEKKLVRKAIARDCTVLGICLGAQMIAAACGMQVYPQEKELGWRTIYGCAPAWHRLFPATFEVFHWHTETFDLPEGAALLATGSAVPNQAFLLGRAVGVQFHPEVTAPVIAQWAKDLGDAERLMLVRETKERMGGNRQICSTLMDAFCAGWNR